MQDSLIELGLRWFKLPTFIAGEPILSAENKKQLWIPAGFAHAFLTLSDRADFLYKTTNTYSKENERSIPWNGPDINIDWPQISAINISEKDKQGCLLKNADLF